MIARVDRKPDTKNQSKWLKNGRENTQTSEVLMKIHRFFNTLVGNKQQGNWPENQTLKTPFVVIFRIVLCWRVKHCPCAKSFCEVQHFHNLRTYGKKAPLANRWILVSERIFLILVWTPKFRDQKSETTPNSLVLQKIIDFIGSIA